MSLSEILGSAVVVLIGIGLGLGRGLNLHHTQAFTAAPAPTGDRITEDDILRITEDGTQREVE